MASTDRDALLALFHSTGGAHWTRKDNWGSDADLSQWEGIEKVNADGRVVKLSLWGNGLQGPIPPELGNLAALTSLDLQSNKLNGPIPPELGALSELRELRLPNNNLTGLIPKELGALSKLQTLWLSRNDLTGTIPTELGKLTELTMLWLHNNHLSGLVPKELGALSKLGTVSELKALRLQANHLVGGPSEGESLDTWRARLRQQQDKRAAAPERASSTEERNTESSFGAQLASFAELDELTRTNRENLEGVKQLFRKPNADRFLPGADLPDADKLRELDRLLALAKALGEVASRHVEDEDMQRKEQSLPSDLKAYYVTVRTGLCNAYLAASVVASGLVPTSKTGGLSMAGDALKLLSGAVPVFGGLASLAGAALKAGDRHIQTRRVVKITDMAADAIECCSLARRLALRPTDGMTAGTLSTTTPGGKSGETGLTTTAMVGGGAGVIGWIEAKGASGEESEEAFLEWFVEEVANCELDNGAGKITSEQQAGRELGKRHLQRLLDAVGWDCLQGTNTIEQKVERLFKVVAPETIARPVAPPPATPEESLERPPVSVSPHTESVSLDHPELAAMRAKLDALEIENKKLTRKVAIMEKRIPGSSSGDPTSDAADAGEGRVLMQRRKAKTQQERWEELAESATAADRHHSVTHEQLREFAAVQDEKHREHDANVSRLQGAMDAMAAKGKNRKSGHR